ncbi:MAG TPA: hypothetical protein VNY36_01030 [Bacteroidia bacterium]|nr:hypothetical protein [Bacteroidia bacterium]
MQKVTTGEVSFALGIEAYSPQRSEDLQRKARPDEGGERPKQKLSLHTIPAMMVN